MISEEEKIFTKKWFINHAMITCGAFVIACSFVLFITPYKIVPGGVYGISIIIHYLTKGMFDFAPEGLPVGTMGLLLDIPLTIVGMRILGHKFGLKSIYGLVMSSVFIDTITLFWGYKPLVENDALLSCIFGGLLFGIGLGIIFKAKGATGGTDTLAMIIAKYTRVPLGQLLIYIDSVVVLIGLIAFRDWKIPLYSWIVIFITGKVIDYLLQGPGFEKTVFIISDKYEEIRQKILFDIERGGTLFHGEGMYEGKPKKIIYCNLNRRELAILQEYIKTIDPHAFLTVMDANQVIGNGFRTLDND
jgi:uncharacterized membrane-anchored protein YitT (DUF2179 family)